jgi:trans-2,3-dihydro-3-hydroxyanthranilate isomerase
MRLSIVDVFAERRYEGNQLAVIQDAAMLSGDAMQTLARELNFSETTFVTATNEASASVRIFTPNEELPFAGHPTLGTAWVLGRHRDSYRLDLSGADIDVTFRDGLAWMVPPEPELREIIEPGQAAALLGLPITSLDRDWPAQVVYSGAEYCLVAVRSRADLSVIRPDLDALRTLSAFGACFAVCREAYSATAHFAVRMHFFDGVGLREDPATGSASSAFAMYLRALDFSGPYIVEQGFEISRPSRIYLDIGETLRVGGRVFAVAVGELVEH